MTAIYHITHVDNLASIVAQGGLWSDAERIARGLVTTNIGYQHIKERRLRRRITVAARGVLGEYVPFNFCNRSVMLYVVGQGLVDGYDGGQEPIVHLVSSVEAAAGCGRLWAFTDRHAELAYARYFVNLDQLDEVDWSVMPLTFWGGDDAKKEARQAEFLVHQFFPWECIESVGVINQKMAKQVLGAIQRCAHQPAVRVKPSWYY